MSEKSNNESIDTRQERRERKLKKQREKMPQHGKGMAKVYRDSVLKRAKKQNDK